MSNRKWSPLERCEVRVSRCRVRYLTDDGTRVGSRQSAVACWSGWPSKTPTWRRHARRGRQGRLRGVPADATNPYHPGQQRPSVARPWRRGSVSVPRRETAPPRLHHRDDRRRQTLADVARAPVWRHRRISGAETVTSSTHVTQANYSSGISLYLPTASVDFWYRLTSEPIGKVIIRQNVVVSFIRKWCAIASFLMIDWLIMTSQLYISTTYNFLFSY